MAAQETQRAERLKTLADQLDDLVAFADEEEDHVLAAKLEDARFVFATSYGLTTIELRRSTIRVD